jgi:hypothetical protein
MQEPEKITAIILKCARGHSFESDLRTTNTETFMKFVKDGHRATCATCGVSVIAYFENTTYLTADGRF